MMLRAFGWIYIIVFVIVLCGFVRNAAQLIKDKIKDQNSEGDQKND